MPKDPICGMKVSVKEAKSRGLVSRKDNKEFYFCSTNCKNKFENKKIPFHKSEKFGKIFPWFLGVSLVIGTSLSMIFDFMVFYMGIFFIVFSLFKIPDWKGFIKAFKEYDLLAKHIPGYSALYPLIELTLGIFFILNYIYGNFTLQIVLWITLFIMSIGAIGVSIKLSKKEKFLCACLGTWINVPLTKITLLENLLMVIMAGKLLFF